MASQPNRTTILAGLGAAIVGAIATGTTVGLNSSKPTAVAPSASPIATELASQSRQTVPALPDAVDINRQIDRTAASPEPTASATASVRPIAPEPKPTSDRPAKGETSVERCEVRMVKAADPNPPLNLRAQPNADSALLGTIENGAFLDVQQEADGWFQVEAEPASGQRVTAWVAANLTEHGCSTKTARLSFGAGQTGMEIKDKFIGVGAHTYKLAAKEGQRLSLASHAGMVGVMPRVEDPSGKVLFDGQQDTESWSETLVQSGDYQLVFESNFKGYVYGIHVEIR
jgi:hypothetical protein